MELNEKDRERIKEEERARMEARREFVHDHWGHGCHGCWGRHRGFWFLRVIAVVAVVVATVHLLHRECGYPAAGYAAQPQVTQSAPPPAAKK